MLSAEMSIWLSVSVNFLVVLGSNIY
uniref:Uncharacterized protein n=1 Tax=Arundo donax TaxID=35708 RepID=A0A0A9B114_ARUDO